MKAPRALRLNAEDNVMIAVDEIKIGARPRRMARRRASACRAATRWRRRASRRARRCASSARSSASLPSRSSRANGCTSTIASCMISRATINSARARGRKTILPVEEQATFEGYRRANGKTGTRNYLGILTSVNCSATVARLIAREVERSGMLEDYPHVDGVIALVHGTGCGMAGKGEGFETLEAHAMGLCRQSQHGRRHHGRAGLRSVPDRPHEGGIRHSSRANCSTR